MRRLTTDDGDCMMSYLNMFYSDGGKVFIRGSGCAPDFQDVPLVDWIRSASSKQGLRFTADDPEHLYEEIHDVLDEGYETVEGIIALLYRAAIQAAEMRRVLKSIEDILGGTYYDLDRLRELVQADRDGRCVVLPDRKQTSDDGENALKSAMNTLYYHNNPVTRYIADAVAEKLTREAAGGALRRKQNE